MKNRQSTCQYTITVQFMDLENVLSHRKHGNGGDCFSAETTSGPVLFVEFVSDDARSFIQCSELGK
jgi:hypothetical protein